MPADALRAFAPGRVNLIGEHTDYNGGLALPFAIEQGVTVSAAAAGDSLIRASASDLGEQDCFALEDRSPAAGWRAFVRGTVAELRAAGIRLPGAQLQIGGDLAGGGGLSSSAALEVALCLALLALAGDPADAPYGPLGRIEIARLCGRVENDWVGAQTGLLDQLACLFGEPQAALLIDFGTLEIDPVPLRLGDWQLVVLDSGERHAHASSEYNRRREESAEACKLLGLATLREATPQSVERLPEPLRRRAEHVLGENERVRGAARALRRADFGVLGELLNASHLSLRDLYEASTPAVEATRERLLEAGASGARLTGGGFGGNVLGLFAPGGIPPAGSLAVRPSQGARLLAD